MRKTILYILILAVLGSCTKENGVHGKLMEFSVNTPGVVTTKAEVTEESLKAEQNPDKIFIYGTKSDGSTTSLVFDSGVTSLGLNSNTGVWNAKDGVDNYEWDTEGSYYYRFYSYAYSSNAVTSGNSRNLEIDNATYGRRFTVTQPADGDGSGTIDYLLSYMVNVPQSTYPLVPINLEHAMAKVEVDVRIAESMFTTTGEVTSCLVNDVKVSISGIKRKATMYCQTISDGVSGPNPWQVTLGDGSAEYTEDKAEYTEDNIDFTVSNREDINTIAPDMSFIAVPVTTAQMSYYTLTLRYHGVMSDNDYTYEFALKDASPQGWVSGHKVRYVLTIDNSVHLTGSIVDYEDVDYIEAVIVPGQESDKQNQ